jgi:L,D-transpeptidase YbiS
LKIVINISSQTLTLWQKDYQLRQYTMSSALKGVGEQSGSEQTPRGEHIVRAKIGANLPLNTVFRARRPTGEIYNAELAEKFPKRDWILTRILWLSGCEAWQKSFGAV